MDNSNFGQKINISQDFPKYSFCLTILTVALWAARGRWRSARRPYGIAGRDNGPAGIRRVAQGVRGTIIGNSIFCQKIIIFKIFQNIASASLSSLWALCVARGHRLPLQEPARRSYGIVARVSGPVGIPRVALDNRGKIWGSFIFGQKIIIFHDFGRISWI